MVGGLPACLNGWWVCGWMTDKCDCLQAASRRQGGGGFGWHFRCRCLLLLLLLLLLSPQTLSLPPTPHPALAAPIPRCAEGQVSPLAAEDKEAVRGLMLEGVTRAPHAVRVQLGECIRSLVYVDYPEQWPGLLAQVHQYLVSQVGRKGWLGCCAGLRCAVRRCAALRATPGATADWRQGRMHGRMRRHNTRPSLRPPLPITAASALLPLASSRLPARLPACPPACLPA